jgi:hypothetical protein
MDFFTQFWVGHRKLAKWNLGFLAFTRPIHSIWLVSRRRLWLIRDVLHLTGLDLVGESSKTVTYSRRFIFDWTRFDWWVVKDWEIFMTFYIWLDTIWLVSRQRLWLMHDVLHLTGLDLVGESSKTVTYSRRFIFDWTRFGWWVVKDCDLFTFYIWLDSIWLVSRQRLWLIHDVLHLTGPDFVGEPWDYDWCTHVWHFLTALYILSILLASMITAFSYTCIYIYPFPV